MDIRDRLVVITGGASGIGAAMARRFKADGARMGILADLNGDLVRRTADELGWTGVPLDVADEPATIEMIETVERDHGPIDLLCLNAGIPTGGDLSTSNDDWERTWQVNVMSHVYAVRAVLPGMLARGSGYLLHTASAAGLLTNIGAAPYSVTKHAVVALAEWLSVTYGDSGIKVSCLCPQFVDTPMLDVFEGQDQPRLSRFVRDLAIDPDEVAAAVMAGIGEEKFLILPHPEVSDYFSRKATDYDRWLGGMRKLQAGLR